MKVMYSFLALSILVCPFAFAQEDITLTTYFPTPVGRFLNLRVGDNTQYIDMGVINDSAGDDTIALRLIDTDGDRPWIGFDNDADQTEYDWVFEQRDDDQFYFRGGDAAKSRNGFYFQDRNGLWNAIWVNKVWFCPNP